MTSKIEIESANEQELCRALAEKPCPECLPELPSADCSLCQGTGLACPWASEECPDFSTMWPSERELHGYCKKCSGSGRVPKALALEELVEQRPVEVIEALRLEYYGQQNKGKASSWLFAALRAVAKAVL